MRIRKFRPDDARKVSYLVRKTLRDVNSLHYSDSVIKSMSEYYSPKGIVERSRGKTIFIAVEGEKIIGTANVDTNLIGAVFIHPDYMNKGIGSKLMDKCEKHAKKHGIKNIMLKASVNAIEFYEKLGYTRGKRNYHKKGGETCTMMKKML